MNGPELPKKKRAVPIGTWRRKCDKAMQIKGQEMFPKSLLSGHPTQVMHHFVPKSVCARLRYEWDNLIPLTHGEHLRLHQSGDLDYEQRIIEIKGPEWYEKIRKMRREEIKVNVEYYKEVFSSLSQS